MTKEEKRIKIAEACGWTNIGTIGNHGVPFGLNPTKELRSKDRLDDLPDYFADLNTCAEMEKTLDDDGIYVVWLKCVIHQVSYEEFQWPVLGFDAVSLEDIVRANADQRAEAFGLTLGLWKEGE